MDRVGQAAIRECLREAHSALGADGYASLANQLVRIDPEIPERRAINYLHNQSIGEFIDRLTQAAVKLIAANIPSVEDFYVSRGEPSTYHYILSLVARFVQTTDRSALTPRYAFEQIFANWRRPFATGSRVLPSGIYQMFRRYKPTRGQIENDAVTRRNNYREDQNHVMVCELVYFDSVHMECLFVTCEKHMYWGALFTNHQEILYALIQRPSATIRHGVHQRLLTLKLSGSLSGLYSGLCLKTGDITERPLCAEVLFLMIPEAEHQELYTEFNALRAREWSAIQVPDNSILMDYIIEFPTPYARGGDLERAKYVRDFPIFSEMVKRDNYQKALFRESLRSLPQERLESEMEANPLTVFRHSTFRTRNNLIEPSSVHENGQ